MERKDWDYQFNFTKRMIDKAYLSGLSLVEVSKIFLDIMTGEEVVSKQRTPSFIDRIPRKDSITSKDGKNEKYPTVLNSFIFWEGCTVESHNPGPKLVPLAITNLNDQRSFGQAMIFYEKLDDYVPLLQAVIESQDYKRFGDDIYTNSSEINTQSFDPEMLDRWLEDPEDMASSVRVIMV